MNVQLFKEPAPVFVISAIITMIFMFVESRYKGEKKPFRDYLVYGSFVGIISIFLQYMFYAANGNGKYYGPPSSVSNPQHFLLDRFPN